MKILFFITRAELGGGQTHVVDLLRGLRDEFDVELAVGETGYLTESADALGVRWHLVPDLVQPMRPAQDLLALWQSVRLIRSVRPDLVHAHTSKAGVIGRFAARIAGVPSIFTAHTWCFAEGTSWKWKLAGIPIEKLAARITGRIITVSDANRDLAIDRKIARPDKFTTVHNGISDRSLRADMKADVPRIVMVARFSEQKAQAMLVDAVNGIQTPFRLSFVGDGPLKEQVEEQVNSLGLKDRVEFLGQRLDIPEILASSQIFALSTKWEGFPISILEAMRAGLPVVASSVNGVPESITDGKTGFLIPAGDVAAFRHRLEQLLSDASLRARMGTAGRARFDREFTVDAMLRSTVAVYRDVLKPSTASAVPGTSRKFSTPPY